MPRLVNRTKTQVLKKLLRILLLIIISAVVIIGITGFLLNEPKPNGVEPSKADILAKEMLTAVNLSTWENTNFIQWTFANTHHYLWDRKRNYVKVEWNDYSVLLNTKQLHKSVAYENGAIVEGADHDALVQKAWSFFCNDSFWLCAHTKLFDPGTQRYLVEGSTQNELMVSYESGGVTPGDTYVWTLDENSKPLKYKMWVNIIPIGGLEASWDDLVETETGALLPKSHSFGFLTIQITDLKTAFELNQISDSDPFTELR